MPSSNVTKFFSNLRCRRMCGVFLATLVMAVALPVLNTFFIYPAFTHILISSIEEDAQKLAKHTLPASLKYTKLTHKSLNNKFFAEIYKLEHNFDLMKVKVFSSDGEVLYSTESMDIGHLNTKPYFREVITKGRPYSKIITKESNTMEGQAIPLDVVETYAPFMDGDKFLGAFELYYDITSRKERLDRLVLYSTATMAGLSLCLLIAVTAMLRKEAARVAAHEKAERLKEDVERITRHDLKTPLTGILGGVQYLENYSTLDQDQAEIVHDMREAANKGMDIITHSLDLYKMETGNYEYVPETVNILETVRRVHTDLARLANERNVEILTTRSGTIMSGTDSVMFPTDETLYYSLTANLLKNAIEASGAGDKVTLNISCPCDCTMTIHNPASVPDEIRDTFFDKYTTAGKTTGTGLGTYSAKLMAKTMGGTIHMTTSEEDGTRLTVTLPSDTQGHCE